jgi:hypothetical protein
VAEIDIINRCGAPSEDLFFVGWQAAALLLLKLPHRTACRSEIGIRWDGSLVAGGCCEESPKSTDDVPTCSDDILESFRN